MKAIDDPNTSHPLPTTQRTKTREPNVVKQVGAYKGEEERDVLEEVEQYEVDKSKLEEEASRPRQSVRKWLNLN